MNSTLKLLKNMPLLEERNFKVDNFSEFIESRAYTEVRLFQYIKHSLNLSIKIELSQENLEFVQANNINYVLIKNNYTNAKEVAYFVVNKKWLADQTIQLDLRMDTINSFLDSCILSDKTKILREHKDRFKYVPSGERQKVTNVDPYIFETTEIDTNEGEMVSNIYKTATDGIHEETYIITKVIDSLPTELSYDNGFVADYICSDHEFQEIEVFTLDSNYNVVRFIERYNDESGAIEFKNGTWYGYRGSVINLQSNEMYFALRIRYRYYQQQIEREEEVTSKVRVYLSGGWYDEPTQEDKTELYNAYNQERGNIFKTGEFVGGDKLLPVIDRYSENINPMLYGKTIRTLQEKYYLNQSWYLAYMNQNSPTESLSNPVDCFVIPERTIYAKPSATTTNLTLNGREMSDALFPVLNVPSWDDWNERYMTRRYVFIHPKNNNGCYFKVRPAVATDTSPVIDITINRGDTDLIILTPYRGFTGVLILGYGYDPIWYYYDGTATFEILDGQKAVQGSSLEASSFEEIADWPVFPLFQTAGESETISTIDNIDRTDPKIIKIIKLPYCPLNCYQDSQNYIVYDITQWQTASIQTNVKVFKFRNVAGNVLQRLIEFDGENPFSALVNDMGFIPSLNMLKSADYETKLYNSEFYQPKVIYDSFGFTFNLELMDAVNELSTFRVNFNVTTGIMSRFMFTFIDYNCSETELLDYNNVMYVSRNNEITIYNQQWLNYLRTGYNFDRASNDIKNDQLAITTGYQGAFNILDKGANGFATGGSAGAIMGTGRGMMDFGMRIYTMVNEVKMNEMSLHRKEVASQYATTGIIDANDVDLMTSYAKNLLTYKIYKVSPRMRKVLFDLFFYTGYVANYMGIPNTTSRTYFNYVSAEIVFKELPNLPKEIIDDIKARYLAGITFMHKVGSTYDFDQKYENWEVSLFENE